MNDNPAKHSTPCAFENVRYFFVTCASPLIYIFSRINGTTAGNFRGLFEQISHRIDNQRQYQSPVKLSIPDTQSPHTAVVIGSYAAEGTFIRASFVFSDNAVVYPISRNEFRNEWRGSAYSAGVQRVWECLRI